MNYLKILTAITLFCGYTGLQASQDMKEIKEIKAREHKTEADKEIKKKQDQVTKVTVHVPAAIGASDTLDLTAVETVSQETFQALLDEQEKAGQNLLLARVVTQDQNTGDYNISYYDAQNLLDMICGEYAPTLKRTVVVPKAEMHKLRTLYDTAKTSNNWCYKNPNDGLPIQSIHYFSLDPQNLERGAVSLCSHHQLFSEQGGQWDAFFYINQKIMSPHSNVSDSSMQLINTPHEAIQLLKSYGDKHYAAKRYLQAALYYHAIIKKAQVLTDFEITFRKIKDTIIQALCRFLMIQYNTQKNYPTIFEDIRTLNRLVTLSVISPPAELQEEQEALFPMFTQLLHNDQLSVDQQRDVVAALLNLRTTPVCQASRQLIAHHPSTTVEQKAQALLDLGKLAYKNDDAKTAEYYFDRTIQLGEPYTYHAYLNLAALAYGNPYQDLNKATKYLEAIPLSICREEPWETMSGPLSDILLTVARDYERFGQYEKVLLCTAKIEKIIKVTQKFHLKESHFKASSTLLTARTIQKRIEPKLTQLALV